MSRYIELPSEEIIDIESVVYVSKIKLNISTMEFWFSVLFTNREKITFSFNDKHDCINERNIIKNNLLNTMICD
jgi:hypothetical protein